MVLYQNCSDRVYCLPNSLLCISTEHTLPVWQGEKIVISIFSEHLLFSWSFMLSLIYMDMQRKFFTIFILVLCSLFAEEAPNEITCMHTSIWCYQLLALCQFWFLYPFQANCNAKNVWKDLVKLRCSSTSWCDGVHQCK